MKIYKEKDHGSAYVAQRLADVISEKQKAGKKAILGMATGSTPKGVYRELIRLHRDEGLSFKNVHTFNLDEYYRMLPENVMSYNTFMKEHLFDHIDIPAENTNIINGDLELEEIENHCAEFEKKIYDLGGIDIQLLGIGRSGHIGFNEPGSATDSRTRLVNLCEITRNDAISDFNGLENVPTQAITMGVRTILDAKEIIMIAWGNKKSEIVQKTFTGEISADVPATYLLTHPKVEVILDHESSAFCNKMLPM
ncbi:MAG: glucosamine-6-phosphate deaminase [Flavobacteriaceae bacterium]|nr:glucosamine-6-phosphate deaminase [Flavobacteriaceae bacterium]